MKTIFQSVHNRVDRKVQRFPVTPTCIAPHYQHPLSSGPSVIMDGATQTRRPHPESTVDIRVHSECCAFCGFGQT